MPVPFVLCRNPETGATAEIPVTALEHMSAWIPVEPNTDEQQAPAEPSPPAEEPPATARGRAAKSSKADQADTTPKED